MVPRGLVYSGQLRCKYELHELVNIFMVSENKPFGYIDLFIAVTFDVSGRAVVKIMFLHKKY